MDSKMTPPPTQSPAWPKVPPPPPRCVNFEDEGADGCWFSYPASGVHDIVWLRLPDNAGHVLRTDFERRTPKWRPIIAAVAECAWLREAERENKEARKSMKSRREWSKHDDAEELARQHARAWRSWGAST